MQCMRIMNERHKQEKEWITCIWNDQFNFSFRQKLSVFAYYGICGADNEVYADICNSWKD